MDKDKLISWIEKEVALSYLREEFKSWKAMEELLSKIRLGFFDKD